jgi:hypothetical protein
VPFLVGKGLDVSDSAGAVASGRHISRENFPAEEGGTPESDFWWRVFEADWFFLVIWQMVRGNSEAKYRVAPAHSRAQRIS